MYNFRSIFKKLFIVAVVSAPGFIKPAKAAAASETTIVLSKPSNSYWGYVHAGGFNTTIVSVWGDGESSIGNAGIIPSQSHSLSHGIYEVPVTVPTDRITGIRFVFPITNLHNEDGYMEECPVELYSLPLHEDWIENMRETGIQIKVSSDSLISTLHLNGEENNYYMEGLVTNITEEGDLLLEKLLDTVYGKEDGCPYIAFALASKIPGTIRRTNYYEFSGTSGNPLTQPIIEFFTTK